MGSRFSRFHRFRVFKTPMGLEPFEVRFFLRVKFTKIDLALKAVTKNCNWASSSFKYGYDISQLNFALVKTKMGLERFENVPRS